MAPTSPPPQLPAASGIPAVNGGNSSPSSYSSSDSDTEKPPDVPHELTTNVEVDAAPLTATETTEVATAAEPVT
jgi:hypothetical protein